MEDSRLLHYKIGQIEINEATASVTLNGQEISLPKLSYKLLTVLAQHSPNLITEQQLIEEVWENRVVTRDTIQQRVKLLRQAIGDKPQDPMYIGNVHGQGYKLLFSVEPVENKSTVRSQKKFRILIALMIVSMGFLLYHFFGHPNPPQYFEQSSNPQLEETENNFDRNKHSENSDARRFYFNGRGYLSNKQVEYNDAAIIQFKKALELDPDYALAFTGLVHAYVEQNEYFPSKEQGLDKALEAAKTSVELRGDIVETHYALAIAYHFSEQFDLAKKSYRKALDIFPNHSLSLVNLSYLERVDGNYQESLKLAFKLVALDPGMHLGYVQVAENYRLLGHTEFAIEWYKKTLTFGPHNRTAQFNLCNLYIEQYNVETAEVTCRDIISWAPQSSWPYEWKAELELLRGNQDEAISLFAKAMDIGSNYATFRYGSLIRSQKEAIQFLENGKQGVLNDIKQNPNNVGYLQNIAEFYAVTNNHQMLYHTMDALIEREFTNYLYFMTTSAYSQQQHDHIFLRKVEKIRAMQRELQTRVDLSWVVLPNSAQHKKLIID